MTIELMHQEVTRPPDYYNDSDTATIDGTRTYIDRAVRWNLLTAEQEVELAKSIEAGLYAGAIISGEFELDDRNTDELQAVVDGGELAKARLTMANTRLVMSVAKRYRGHPGYELDDSVSQGNIGLIRAVEKFDYTKGYKFSTYATWWIRKLITTGLMESQSVRLPPGPYGLATRIYHLRNEHYEEFGEDLTPEDLAVIVKEPVEEVRLIMNASGNHVSLDAASGDDGNTTIGDYHGDERSEEGYEQVDHGLLQEEIREALGYLTKKEATYVRVALLYPGSKPPAPRRIAGYVGCRVDGIPALHAQVLDKLRACAPGLQEYLYS